MKFFSIILILPFFISLSAYAQKGKVAKGYIIDNKGDRIEGYVQIQKNEIENMVKVKFSEKEKTKKYTLYKPKDIPSYGFEIVRQNNANEDYTHLREFIKYDLERPAKLFATNTSFIEKIVDGPLEIYEFIYEVPSNVEQPITTRYIVFQAGREIAQIEEANFKKKSQEIFVGYDAMNDSLGKMNFRFNNFPRLVDDYNYWLANQHDANTYKMNPNIFNQ